MKKRLQTILAHAGAASRRQAAKLIEEGHVTVNGRIITERGERVDPEKAKILLNGKELKAEERKYYFLFNKPKGVISTAKDTHARKKVTDFFRKFNVRLYPIGRLDKDTTGILIMTNDGALAYKLAHPAFEVGKEYEASVEGGVSPGAIAELQKGVALEGSVTAPCKIVFLKKVSGYSVYRVILHEGRKRQVRRMFEHVGARVVELRRTGYAGLALEGLKEGEFRALSKKEIEQLTGGTGVLS